MKRLSSSLSSVFLAVVILGLACVAAPGQVTTAPTVKFKQPKPKIDKFKGEVVNCTPAAITVRDPNKVTTIRTFTFHANLKGFMENRFMESGSKVTVRYVHGTDTAMGLQGKIIRR